MYGSYTVLILWSSVLSCGHTLPIRYLSFVHQLPMRCTSGSSPSQIRVHRTSTDYLLATVPFQVVRARMRRTTYVRGMVMEYLHTEKPFLQYKVCKSLFTEGVWRVQVWNLREIICEVCLTQSLPHHKVSRQWVLVIGPLEAALMVWEVIFARFFLHVFIFVNIPVR